MYNRESHAIVPEGRPLAAGDRLDVVRGNGPREGERMGTATVTELGDDGGVTLFFLPDVVDDPQP